MGGLAPGLDISYNSILKYGYIIMIFVVNCLNHIMKGHRFVCVFVCVSPSPGRIVAPIVVIFGTRVLCRPGKVIGYQKRAAGA